MSLSRRSFLTRALGSSALVSLAPGVPRFLLAAAADAGTAGADRVLVVVQLTGGNDGLNTVIPFGDELYRRARPTLAIPEGQVLKIDGAVGLHPTMRGLADLAEAGKLAIVQGVGYPHPNRSHFEAMDIWHTCKTTPPAPQVGWLGRYLDASAGQEGRDVPALHLGMQKQPLALWAEQVQTPSIQSLDRFRLERADDEPLRRALAASGAAPRSGSNELLAFVDRGTNAAVASARRVEEALARYTSPVNYPGTPLAQQLRVVAQLIGAGLSTKVYYLTHDGFDTHSNQAAGHANLLAQLSEALKAFLDDLTQQGHAERVLAMTFSEFGRRVQENASRGTDHGAAAPMLFVGGKLHAGTIGAHPSLADLDDGDLKHHTDFRQVYSTVLERWLAWPSEAILGGRFEPVPLVDTV